jgi:hypothetical protein
MTTLEALGAQVVKAMEVELLHDIGVKDVNIDERILNIMRVQAVFDGELDQFERWVNERK